MESEKQMLHALSKGLKAEFEATKFYLDNLQSLNYAENKAAIEILALESLEHARWLIKKMLEISADEGGPLRKGAVQAALLEEFSMREIYKYELSRTSDDSMKELMKKLIAVEEKHEQLVDRLK
jgi:rubrerythrin